LKADANIPVYLLSCNFKIDDGTHLKPDFFIIPVAMSQTSEGRLLPLHFDASGDLRIGEWKLG
jgi:hypothetical protein